MLLQQSTMPDLVRVDMSNVDLCVVDGSPSIDRLNLLTKIADYSCISMLFNSVKIFSGYPDLQSYNSTSSIQYFPVSINSYDAYSRFIIKDLYGQIDAEYCLIFQHDGFIINPHLWSEDFLNHDYIGAVFPNDHWCRINRVGNGGFSLRSKEFMEFCSKLDYSVSLNEDQFICVDNYHNIISQGLRFAPVDVAARFSIEEQTEYNNINQPTFGFHGSWRRPNLYSRTAKYINDLQ